ncbi:YeiH family protein [Streptomyces pinistramenti]|uniref:YeiH family protein n=1 Tax=Streptomyces pinistramenti TaxID=2884812 RepID=UPI001D065268|nr:putative sulfate exporter family transporter [Streptomyces pinistramenti]MCB5907514.1 putative sulfate exporter family transporter [Streptomyces pinistramenti]
MTEAPAATSPGAQLRRPLADGRHKLPGLALAVVVAAVASAAGRLVPSVSPAAIGLLLGAALAAVRPPGARWRPGLSLAGSRCLRLAVVAFGTGLDLRQTLRVSAGALPFIALVLGFTLLCALVLGRVLKVGGNLRILIAVGTGICGTSAIAAITPVIAATEAEIAYAVGSIVAFNTLAVILFPALAHLAALSQHSFGLWCGTAIHDTSSVLAAAYSFGPSAGATSLVVKLTRTLAIIPISCTLAAAGNRRSGRPAPGEAATSRAVSWRRMLPLFLLGFLAAVAVNTAGWLPASWHPFLSGAGTYLATTALSAIGLSLRIADIRAAGPRPLLLAGLVWAGVAVVAFALLPLA